jgi:hypothetical protein
MRDGRPNIVELIPDEARYISGKLSIIQTSKDLERP